MGCYGKLILLLISSIFWYHYALAELLEMSTPEDDALSTYPLTFDPFDLHSLDTLPTILEDQPFEATEAEVGAELDPFGKELNDVLTFDRGAPEKGEITVAPIDP